jgi:hypothetical protein
VTRHGGRRCPGISQCPRGILSSPLRTSGLGIVFVWKREVNTCTNDLRASFPTETGTESVTAQNCEVWFVDEVWDCDNPSRSFEKSSTHHSAVPRHANLVGSPSPPVDSRATHQPSETRKCHHGPHLRQSALGRSSSVPGFPKLGTTNSPPASQSTSSDRSGDSRVGRRMEGSLISIEICRFSAQDG